jgi:predicted transcriptional regulator of viral defense system
MNASQALSRLQGLGVPAVTTADAAAVLAMSIEATSHTLRRLAVAGLVTPVRKGLWALGPRPDPLTLCEHVTMPFPSYASLQTALYRHGMVMQIPAIIYLVSLGRSARIETRLGTYSVHHVVPEIFGGFEVRKGSTVKLASPEKALVDLLYLSPTRSRLFAALPELEIPPGFRRRVARRWARQIPSQRARTIVERKLDALLGRQVS